MSPSAASGQGFAPQGVPEPDKNLGRGWKTSTDRLVTTAADAGGLRVLAADGSDAYSWKTVAVLAEPGMQADTWIGNECVMDRSHVAVAYAPRTFTNRPDLMLGGAFTAIVDIESGRVTKLPFTASLAYFDPSCNPATGTAVFSAFRDDRSRLLTVDTTGGVVSDTDVLGQVTSAVPVADGTVAARGRKLVHVDRKGKVKNLATTSEVPSEIRPSGKSQIAFLDHQSGTAYAKLWRGDRNTVATLATGKLGDLGLKQGRAGKVFLTGTPAAPPRTAGTEVVALSVAADAAVSGEGRLAVAPVLSSTVRRGLDRIKGAGRNSTTTEPSRQDAEDAPASPEDERPVTVTVTAAATGEEFTQAVRNTGRALGKDTASPALSGTITAAPSAAGSTTSAAASAANDPVDTDRWCSVPRNDVNSQALQPTPNQVEWAVDMAIRGELRSQWITQGGWRSQTGLGVIDPQGLFPRPELKTGGRIPAQVLLGVLAQESNLWQAESGAIPGQMGNPLAAVAGFYGHKGTDSDSYWKIHWENSDCGYGIGQVTDGMRMAGHEKPGETALSPVKQRAVALDYTVNIAASMYILADKWNELHTDGQKITVNNDDPAKPENWFAALWNYNLGFNPPTTPGAPWGLGWYNNPANPMYPASRGPFMENSPRDAATPQKWPYPEKVLGWAAWSMDTGRSYSTSGRQDWPGEPGFASAGFRPAWWISVGDRTRIKPPLSAFCNTANNCDPNNPPQCSTEICYMQYWYRGYNVTWKNDCASTCGHEDIKYQTLRTEPGRGTRLQYGTPTCEMPSGFPSNAFIVESLPNGTQTWSECGPSLSAGSFQFSFNPDAEGKYEAKGDLHQIGGGYGGHFWYAHTRDTAHLGGPGGRMTVTGTWTLGQSFDKWVRVFAHMPDTGTHTQQAHYVIKGVAGGDRHRYVNTHYSANTWVDLGVYHFTGTPKVELSNTTDDGTADEDIAWDAVAFQPLPGKPKHMVVAMGDSYSSGEGAGAYSPESNTSHGTSRWNACRRSANSWARKVVLPSQSAGIGWLSDGFSSVVAFQNVSCSGAMTKNVAYVPSGNAPQAHGEGQFREVRQVDSGVLDSNTTLVMLTLGGNDESGFANAMTECGNLTNCSSDSTFLPRNKAIVDRMIPDLRSVLETIAAKAPNATVVLMGYPELLSRTVKCSGSLYYDMTEVAALAELVNYADTEQQKMVDGLRTGLKLKIQYANPVNAFVGHGGCDDPEWINKIVIGPNGDGDFHAGDPASEACTWKWLGGDCLSRESFHPNNSGTTGYAQVMSGRLNDIGYKGI
ncbi:SGNH/GDSL hydrolase family protein [Streptomyces sp. CC208A]|uniref:SGNH/GDSL hydrolase family protein n=1 Tax=Streptomyces sp. CC208A TaxID=3044573 RepID=UPI0024A865EA|nr:SGNH/GDSL hydrolase family protein [Streptomyces sp. CC208A]